MTQGRTTGVRTRTFLIAGFVLALILAGVVSFYASGSPDGLEKVSADKGIDAKAKDHRFQDGPLADYGVEGVTDERLSGGLAGVIGVGATLLVGTGLFLLVRQRRTPESASESASASASAGS